MKEDMKTFVAAKLRAVITFPPALMACGLIILVCCGCTRRVYVPVESVRTEIRRDTVRETLISTDKEIDRDTVRETVRGDTVLREVTRWRIRYRDRTDTLARIRTVTLRDSVEKSVPYPVEKIVEVARPPEWWQRILMWAGGISIAIAAFLLIKRHRT